MFATWKYDRETSEVQNIRQAYDPISARSSQHQACDRCHEKKLKCSGEKDGCDRCISSSIKCEYTRCETRCSRRRKKVAKASMDSREGSIASQSSQLSPQPSYSSRSRKSSVASRRSVTKRKDSSSDAPLPRLADFSAFSSGNSTASSAPSSAGYEVTTFQNTSVHDERITYPRSNTLEVPPVHINGTSVPYQSQYQPNYYPSNDWSRTYPDPQVSATSAPLDPVYMTTMSSSQTYPTLTSPEDYTPFNDYACFPNQTQELWQYCR